MTILHSILLIIAGALVLLGLCWGLLLWDKRRIKRNEYDERQIVERGNAYRISFWTGIVYYLVVITLGAMDGSGEDLHFLVMLGILIQLLVFSFCCLLTNSELPLLKKPGAAIVSDFLFGAWSLFFVFRSGVSLDAEISELAYFDWIELICGIGFIVIGLMQVVQLLCREKE